MKFTSALFLFAAGPALLVAGPNEAASLATAASPDKPTASCCAVPAAKPEAAGCCAAAKPPTARCCSAQEPVAAARPLSDKSLYQLESSWTDDAGQPVSLASLRGQPVVLAMFFASCEYACPVLVNDMKRLRTLMPEAARETTRFVLVTFDTARDTPAVLKAYRERAELEPKVWSLLRGDDASVQELAMLLGVKFKQDARGQFAHSNLITILNAEGEVVHQHAGLMGDVSEAAKAAVLAAK